MSKRVNEYYDIIISEFEQNNITLELYDQDYLRRSITNTINAGIFPLVKFMYSKNRSILSFFTSNYVEYTDSYVVIYETNPEATLETYSKLTDFIIMPLKLIRSHRINNILQ
jgi:hypothetical protein